MKLLTFTIGGFSALIGGVFVYGAFANFNNGRAAEHEEQSRLAQVEEVVGTPIATPEALEYDFGTMDPHTEGEHQFRVTNTGDSPLTVTKGTKTCLCVEFKIDKPVVEPGESCLVTVRWDTKVEAREYRHGASIKTNDPNNKVIKFRVYGRVWAALATEPGRLVFSRLEPDQSAEQKLDLFSQRWNQFDVVDVKSSMEGLTWTIDEAPVELLERRRATSGKEVRIIVPDNLPRGSFHEWLRFTVAPEGDTENTEEIEIGVHGNVIRRLSVYGPKELKDDGTVYFGIIQPDLGAEVDLHMLLRDNEKELAVKEINVWPEFLQVEVKPDQGLRPRPGLYDLNIRIPKDDCSGNYLGVDAAQVRLTFDHPRVKSLELKVEFAVLQPH